MASRKKQNPPKKLEMKQREQKALSLLQEKSYSTKELSIELGCEQKTAQRVFSSLREQGYPITKVTGAFRYYLPGLVAATWEDEDGSVAEGSSANRRRFYILFLINHVGHLTWEDLTKELSPDNKTGAARARNTAFEDEMDEYMLLVTERTLKKDLEELQSRGFVKQKGSYYVPGERLLRIRLGPKKLNLLAYLMRDFEQTSPYQAELSSAFYKIIADDSERISFFDNPYLAKLNQRKYYLGKPFQASSAPGQEYNLALLREKLEQAIVQQRRIRLTYRTDKAKKEYTVYPLQLCYNGNNDCWYLYALRKLRGGYPHLWRLDRVQDFSLDNYRFQWPEGFHRDALAEPAWGVGAEKPIKVKVRFEDLFNIRDKVKRQLKERPQDQFYREGEYWIYEGQISGVDEFLHWLRSFGGSMEILEPPKLRRLVKETARRTLERYGEAVPEE